MRSSPEPVLRRTPTALLCWEGMAADGFFLCNPSAKWPKTFLMSWSRRLADPWRRYLAQQMELGGAEVVLSAGQQVSRSVTAPAVEPGVQTPAPLPRRQADAWRKGAPPIPG